MTHESIMNLTQIVDTRGPVGIWRVSSAKARGRAAQYAYYGAARYEVRHSADGGRLVLVCTSGASSDRRSYQLACKDAEQHAKIRGEMYGEDFTLCITPELAGRVVAYYRQDVR